MRGLVQNGIMEDRDVSRKSGKNEKGVEEVGHAIMGGNRMRLCILLPVPVLPLLRVMLFLFIVLLVSVTVLSGCAEMSIQPDQGPQGAEEMVIELIGEETNWETGVTQASFPSESGIQIVGLDVQSSTSAFLTVSIPGEEPLGSQRLILRTGDEVVGADFDVTPGPEATLSPGEGEQGQHNLDVKIIGTNTHFTEMFDVSVNIPGVSVVSVEVADDDRARMLLNVDESTEVGLHPESVAVYTDHQVLFLDFTITEPIVRHIEHSPAEGEQGEALTVTVTGWLTEFDTSTTVEFSPSSGVDVIATRVYSSTSMEADLLIHSNAWVGKRKFIVTDTAGPLYSEFTITENPNPPSVVLDPDVVMQDEEIFVNAHGTNTHFMEGETTVEVTPPSIGLTVELVSVSSPELAVLRATATPDAHLTTYQVTLTTGGEHATGQIAVVAQPEDPVVFLHPATGRQGETVEVEVQGLHTHFDETTQLIFPPGSMVEVKELIVENAEFVWATLEIDETAPVESFDVTVHTTSVDETVLTGFSVTEGIPSISLAPDSVSQGDMSVSVTAEAIFLNFEGVTPVSTVPECELVIDSVELEDPKTLRFNVTAGLTLPAGPCGLVFDTDQGPMLKYIEVLPGYTSITIPSDVQAEVVDGPVYFEVELAEGEIFSARALRDPWTFLDPVLKVIGPQGDPHSPIAENDDENEATVNSLVVYMAPLSGKYFIEVSDRLGFNTGGFTLSLNHFSPEQYTESSNANDTFGSAEPISHRVVKGGFDEGDERDIFAPQVQALELPSAPHLVAVEIVALSVSPYETSGAEVVLRVYDSAQTLIEEQHTGTYSPDPIIYISPSALGYIEVENQGPSTTVYWLSLRPAVVINELHHDETTGWMAGFVELFGPPGQSLDNCLLAGRARDPDGAPGESEEVFSIDLTGKILNPAGYLVIARDELVPGCGPADIDERLVIEDPDPPGSPYSSIGIFLECGEEVVDGYCYRGNEIPGCEGEPGADITATSVGRGFVFDRNENSIDFIEQIEPNPWGGNLTEVAK